MSGATSPRDRLSMDRFAPGSIVAALVDVFGTPIKRVAFWAAIALPLAYLPLLVGGLEDVEITLFVGLLALNVVAVTLGHGYGN
jgi:hypothetical protein